MYTEGYIKKVELHTKRIWMEPSPPYLIKDRDLTYVVIMQSGPLGNGDGSAHLKNPEVLALELETVDLPSIVNLKTAHCKVGISFEAEGGKNKVTSVTAL